MIFLKSSRHQQGQDYVHGVDELFMVLEGEPIYRQVEWNLRLQAKNSTGSRWEIFYSSQCHSFCAKYG